MKRMRSNAQDYLGPQWSDAERAEFRRVAGLENPLYIKRTREGAPDLASFLSGLPSYLLPHDRARRAMSFLMDRQYRGFPPNPCPCY
ncbi:MAG TPA: hypothetical protein VGE53_00065 [Candidatus Paceibacterota bacterium]